MVSTRDRLIRKKQTPEELEAVRGTQLEKEGFFPDQDLGKTRDPGNFACEVVPGKNTIWDLDLDTDIEVHRYGKNMNKYTYRAHLTRRGRITPLGRRLVNLAVAGKPYTYIAKAAGLSDQQMARYIMLNNPILRNAVLEMQALLVEEAGDIMIRGIRKISRKLVRMAAGEDDSTPNAQKVELMAIQEYFNRLGYGAARMTGGKVEQSELSVKLTGKEGSDLTVLVQRRQARLKSYEDSGSPVMNQISDSEEVDDIIEAEVIGDEEVED